MPEEYIWVLNSRTKSWRIMLDQLMTANGETEADIEKANPPLDNAIYDQKFAADPEIGDKFKPSPFILWTKERIYFSIKREIDCVPRHPTIESEIRHVGNLESKKDRLARAKTAPLGALSPGPLTKQYRLGEMEIRITPKENGYHFVLIKHRPHKGPFQISDSETMYYQPTFNSLTAAMLAAIKNINDYRTSNGPPTPKNGSYSTELMHHVSLYQSHHLRRST